MSPDNLPDDMDLRVGALTAVADELSLSCNAGHQLVEKNNNVAQGNCGCASADDSDSDNDRINTKKNDAKVVLVNGNSSTIIDSEDVLQQGQLRPAPRNNDAIVQPQRRSNYTNAHISTLGTDSDRMDFCQRPQLSSKDNNERCERREVSEDDTNSVVSLKKIRKWLSTSSSPGYDVDDECNGNGEYHKFGSKDYNNITESMDRAMRVTEGNEKNAKHTLDDNGIDESLLNDKRKIGQKSRRIHPWVKQSTGVAHRPPTLAGTEEEERVMGECSFFYNNMDDIDMMKLSSQQIVLGTKRSLQAHDEKEQENGYLEHPQDLHQRYHYRTRRLDPRIISNVIKTSAKRQWTERRYRRRLRQSQLGMVSFDGIANSESTFSKNNNSHGRRSQRRLLQTRQDDSSTSYWHTKEHQRAFIAAHSALNGKLAYENGSNNRKNTSYEYDIDDDYYDLELAITQDDDAEEGGGETACAYVTKSSLAIRGGLIRLPTDNVRLVCDPMLQPGILSIETREHCISAGGGGDGDGRGNNHNSVGGVRMLDNSLPQSSEISNNTIGISKCKHVSNSKRRLPKSQQQTQQHHHQLQQWSRQELAYVLTVDERIYQRVVQEMGDSYRIPCGMYYCCHVTTGGDHVGIGVAVAILSLLFLLLVAGMIAWPTV